MLGFVKQFAADRAAARLFFVEAALRPGGGFLLCARLRIMARVSFASRTPSHTKETNIASES